MQLDPPTGRRLRLRPREPAPSRSPNDRRGPPSVPRPRPMHRRRTPVRRVRLAVSVGEVRRRVALRATRRGVRRAIELRRSVPARRAIVSSRSTGSRRARWSRVRSTVAATLNIANRAAHSADVVAVESQPRSAAAAASSQLPEHEVDIGRRGVENGLMPSVDRQRVGFGEVAERPIGVTESGREHRPCPSQPKQTSRERAGNGLAGEDRRQPRTSGRVG